MARRLRTALGVFALLVVAASCIDDASSPRIACDDLRSAFVAKSEMLGCGFSAAGYACTALGGVRCNGSDIDACMSAIDGSADCRSLDGAGNCVLHCE